MAEDAASGLFAACRAKGLDLYYAYLLAFVTAIDDRLLRAMPMMMVCCLAAGQAEWLELDVTQLMHSQPSWTEDDDSICADFTSNPSEQPSDPHPAGSSSATSVHQHDSSAGGISLAAKHATGSTATSGVARPTTVSRFAGDRVLLWHCGPDVTQNGPGTCSIEVHSE